jgi:hypothetical protein
MSRSAYGFCQGLRGAVRISAICSEAIRDRTVAAINAVPVPQQIARSVVLGEGLDNLLRRPGCRGVVPHVEVAAPPDDDVPIR